MRVCLKCCGLLLLVLITGCERGSEYPSRPLTIICPWAAGGGTDRVSRQMAMLLEQRLGEPVSVINATGGKGVTGHNRGLRARPDGYTLTMITLELNTMHWAGLTDLTYQDCQPLVSLNEDYAALMVRSDASWQTISELESAVAENPGGLTASGTAVGGAWHLALAGWLVSADLGADAVTWVPSAGANPSLQQLISGGVDMVCCSLPEARSLLESGEVRALGLMAPRRAIGFESIPTFIEQGRDWTLGGWRGLAVPKETPPAIVDKLVEVLTEIVSEEPVDGSFAQFMETQKFDHTWRSPDDFREFLADTDRKLGDLLSSEAMKSINEDRFSPMTYPWTLIGLIGITLVGLGVRRGSPSEHEWESRTDESGLPASRDSWIDVGLVIAAIALYAALAEAIGFVAVASGITLVLLLRFKTRLITSLILTALIVPAIYVTFAMILRVPLP